MRNKNDFERGGEGRGRHDGKGRKSRGEGQAFGRKDSHEGREGSGGKRTDRDWQKDGPARKREGGPERSFNREKTGGFRGNTGNSDRFDRNPDRTGKPAFSRSNEGGDRPFNRERSQGFERKRNEGDRPFSRERAGGFKRENDDSRRPFNREQRSTDFDNRKERDERPYNRERAGGFKRDNDGNSRPFNRERTGGFDNRNEGGERPYSRERAGGFKRNTEGDGRFSRERSSEERRSEERPRATRSFGERRPESGFRDRPERERGNREFRERPARRFPDDENKRQPTAPARGFRDDENDGGQDSQDGPIRLNRFIANAGICSRREADELIESGQITVNGQVVSEMGFKVKPSDIVKYGKRILNAEKLVYILLNKPKDYITTTEDPEDRKTVLQLIEGACEERVYPVGRLDRNTTGLLLITNDGELADKLTHPSNNIRKVYQAELDKPITLEDFEALKEGAELEDGFIKPDDVGIVTPDAYVVGIEIHSGRNRIVRRLFEHFGYQVNKLDRTTFAGLNKKDLPRGKWRFLTKKEVITLKFLT
ncbi:pseudouridine synthase [Ravibacter arvi]|uniref:Pseudouridine synthase n=1 Tax=Ravibacter arvi TaxID=2051041 RepID=A0ABP8M1T8_9BACT